MPTLTAFDPSLFRLAGVRHRESRSWWSLEADYSRRMIAKAVSLTTLIRSSVAVSISFLYDCPESRLQRVDWRDWISDCGEAASCRSVKVRSLGTLCSPLSVAQELSPSALSGEANSLPVCQCEAVG